MAVLSYRNGVFFEDRPGQISFVMYLHILLFHNIFLLTYFHIEMFSRAHSAKNVLITFLANTKHFGSKATLSLAEIFLFLKN